MFKTSRLLQVALTVSVFTGCFSSPVFAGFEWTPPSHRETTTIPAVKEATPSVKAVPTTNVDIEPFPFEKEVESFSVPASSMVSMVKEKPAKEYDVVMGFGKDIPLVLALRQIVPPQYAFSFDPEVDQAIRVDWNGNKPWDQIVTDAISPEGLAVFVVDHTVWIRTAAAVESEEKSFTDVLSAALKPKTAEEEKSAPVFDEPADVVAKQEKVTTIVAPSEPPIVTVSAPPALPVPKSFEKDYSGYDYNPSYPRRNPMPLTGDMVLYKEEMKQEPKAEFVETVDAVPPVIKGSAVVKQAASSETEMNDPFGVNFWQAEEGDSLRDTLAAWSGQAGVEMIWGAFYDYRLPTAIKMHGTFADAVRSVLTIYDSSNDRPYARLHSNLSDGSYVLVVESQTTATQ